ncbi:MAG TPA: hypothetical protein DCG25_10320 [Acidimicrobiaceae bacterium]|nr:hypothetical protein [Acidimicrobiaceae bacterium]
MKPILLVIFLLACQTEPRTEPAPTAGIAQADAKSDSTPDAPKVEEKSDEDTPIAEPTDDKEDAQNAPATDNDKETKTTDAARPEQRLFVGYDQDGKKGSLPMICAMCKRMRTEPERQFVTACTAQGGKTQSCGCLKILCSVKVK